MKRTAIIGAGASGCICAYHLLKAGIDVTFFDKSLPLRTLLPTGGGRCNLAHAEYNFKELAENYPRGSKFLYSVFSKFGTSDTIRMFEDMGIKTYTQDNGRIFPDSNSSKSVQETVLKELRKSGVKFIQEEVIKIARQENSFIISPDNKNTDREFEKLIIATGGHSGYGLLEQFGVKIIPPRPSLVGLNTKENFKCLSGTAVKNIKINGIEGDMLFTHFGVSGPAIYTISSLKAFDIMPYSLNIDLCPEFVNMQEILNKNPHKEIKNIIGKFLPQKLADFILKDIGSGIKGHEINSKTREFISEKIHNFKITVIGTNKGEETVTAGGVDLDEINPKSMEVKKVPNLYCIGEVLNIDGLCGGFNLQNAWSTAYVCAENIIEK